MYFSTRHSNEIRAFKDTLTGVLHLNMPELNLRQLGALLIIYLEPGPHTIRDIARKLNAPRPAIVRVADYLSDLGYIQRMPVPSDGRDVHLVPTQGGKAALLHIGKVAEQAIANHCGNKA